LVAALGGLNSLWVARGCGAWAAENTRLRGDCVGGVGAVEPVHACSVNVPDTECQKHAVSKHFTLSPVLICLSKLC
jgi:hypothetical protein